MASESTNGGDVRGATNYVKVIGHKGPERAQHFVFFSDDDAESVSLACSDAGIITSRLQCAGYKDLRLSLWRAHPGFRCARIVGEG